MNPRIIQGGMGIGVSNWRLARAVGACGQMGVVSGTCIDTVFTRRLQDGDSDGSMRLALKEFPLQELAQKVLSKFFKPSGRAPGEPYQLLSMHGLKDLPFREALSVLGAFVEITLAKMGNLSPVGINLLTKIQLPTLPTLYGAMLAGVDYVLMGAGIPKDIPHALDELAEGRRAVTKLDVQGGAALSHELEFDPSQALGQASPKLNRPKFLAIVSSHSLATMLSKKSRGKVDGFIVEGPTAGGHNAPPRDSSAVSPSGEPIYGERDRVSLEKMRELELPFWIAGGSGGPAELHQAEAEGASGVQVGTLFALCDESGICDSIKQQLLEQVAADTVEMRTDAIASPTGFPFKVVNMDHTISNPAVYESRERVCDLGYLRSAYVDENNKIGFRCPGEPVKQYLAKGGKLEDTAERRCLCNSLLATIGLAQLRDNYLEPALITAGDQIKRLKQILKPGSRSYCAKDVINYLLGQTSAI